jgi:hypothetical protein
MALSFTNISRPPTRTAGALRESHQESQPRGAASRARSCAPSRSHRPGSTTGSGKRITGTAAVALSGLSPPHTSHRTSIDRIFPSSQNSSWIDTLFQISEHHPGTYPGVFQCFCRVEEVLAWAEGNWDGVCCGLGSCAKEVDLVGMTCTGR